MTKKEYPGAKSICTCGHNGDGIESNHNGFMGHGPCNIPRCKCKKFTWMQFTMDFLKWKERNA